MPHLCARMQVLAQGLDHEKGPYGVDIKVYSEALCCEVSKFVIVLVACYKEKQFHLQTA